MGHACRVSLPLLLVAALGCGEDPVAYSAPVGINIEVKAENTVGGVAQGEKGITTESGNPYGAFISEARRRLGRDPSRIALDSLTLMLGGSSVGVTSLDEVFAGPADVLFQMNDTNNSYPAGQFSGAGFTGAPEFDSMVVPAADWAKLLTGSFTVIIRGPAADSFLVKGPKADLQVSLVFSAFP